MILLRFFRIAVASVLLLFLASCQETGPATSQEPFEEIFVSPNDSRPHRSIKLENGLRVILVEDSRADRSAAAMAVSVGSYDNPSDREGLAHFLEHMLFLGTKKYPSPDGFMRFIAKYGGHNNAYTANNHTNYFFEVATSGFGEGLDRFGQFFIAPLFNATYVDKERNAVEAEYKLQFKDDLWRINSVQRKVFNSRHPASKFSIGNLETLAGDDVRDDLLDFYERHYSADRMVLTVVSSVPLATQAIWVRRSFGKITPGPRPVSKVDEPLFNPGQLPVLLEVRPEKELRLLSFDFPIPPLRPNYRAKPGYYIANLLGDEGRGSLHSLLKRRGWIDALAAFASPLWRQDSFLSVNITLTESGSKNWRKIGEALFAYIRLIQKQGPEYWRFEEQRKIADVGFLFQQKGMAVDYARLLAANALEYPLAETVRAPYVFYDYAPEIISEYLQLLTPDNVQVTLITPELETDSTERWFKVHYKLSPLNTRVRTDWQNALLSKALQLPEVNPFIPNDLALIDLDDAATEPSLLPTEKAWAWHIPDTEFGIPDSHLRFRISRASEAPMGIKEYVVGDLYAALVTDVLNEYAYPALLAGLRYSVNQISGTGGITFSLGGYSDHQEKLLKRIMRALTTIRVDPKRVSHYQEEFGRALRNVLKDKPYRRSYDALQEAMFVPAWRPEDLAEAIEAVTVEDIVNWRKSWLADVKVAALLYGNLDRSKALALVDAVTSALPQSRPDTEASPRQIINLSASGSILHNEAMDHADAAMVLYVQGQGRSMEERAKFVLLSQMLRSDYYNHLRTEKQFGYVVAARNQTWVRIPGIVFFVQSPSASAPAIFDATQEFLKDYAGQISGLGHQEFGTYKSAIINQILQTDLNPADRVGRIWDELGKGEVTFDFRQRLAAAVQILTQADMVQFYELFLSGLKGRSFISYTPGKLGDRIKATSVPASALGDFYRLKEESVDKFSFPPISF